MIKAMALKLLQPVSFLLIQTDIAQEPLKHNCKITSISIKMKPAAKALAPSP
jgi:hypothetical protein